MALTAKQQRFVNEYMIDLNATQAAIRAGYSEKTATIIGHENLTKPNIAMAINQAQQDKAKAIQITVEGVVSDIRKVTDKAMEVYLSDPTSSSAANAAFKGLELLGKHIGAFVELQKVNITTEVDSDALRERILKRAMAKKPDN